MQTSFYKLTESARFIAIATRIKIDGIYHCRAKFRKVRIMSRNSSFSVACTSVRTRLITARYQQGWSQQELAEQLGTTRLNVSRWERGLTQPGPFFRQRLSTLFALSPGELDLLPPELTLAQPEIEPTSVRLETKLSTENTCCYDILPQSPSHPSLLGRQEDLTMLKRLLLKPDPAHIAITGLPGVGKTALVAALVHDPEIQARFPDGILWASPGQTSPLEEIIYRWGRLLGVEQNVTHLPTNIQGWTQQLRNEAWSRRLLIVLDDVWEYEEALACQVGGPACSYLLTTRSPVLAKQFGLDISLYLRELDQKESLQLLGTLAPDALDLLPEHIHQLVQKAAGLPLSLTLIGHYLRLHSYSRQPRRLLAAINALQRSRFRLTLSRLPSPLEVVPCSATPAISLEGTIHMSIQRLSTQAYSALAEFSIMGARPNSFSEEEAQMVCKQSVEVLDELSDAGLLEIEGAGRYSLHQSIIDYIRYHGRDHKVVEGLTRTHDHGTLQYESSLLEVARLAAEVRGKSGYISRTSYWGPTHERLSASI
jgi:transcriptional regulator with XRE-family HTH domain